MHAVLLELVAQPVGRLVVARVARLLALADEAGDLGFVERGGARTRRLERVQFGHVDRRDRPRPAVCRAPALSLVVECHAELGQLVAQPIGGVKVTGEAGLLTLGHQGPYRLVRRPDPHRPRCDGALGGHRLRNSGRCGHGRHGRILRALLGHGGVLRRGLDGRTPHDGRPSPAAVERPIGSPCRGSAPVSGRR
eukprot:scaffold5781_cov124-Isochrysis_galbana.AAC.11